MRQGPFAAKTTKRPERGFRSAACREFCSDECRFKVQLTSSEPTKMSDDLFADIDVNVWFAKGSELRKILFGTEKKQDLVPVLNVNELAPEQRERLPIS